MKDRDNVRNLEEDEGQEIRKVKRKEEERKDIEKKEKSGNRRKKSRMERTKK